MQKVKNFVDMWGSPAVVILTGLTAVGVGLYAMRGDKWLAEIGVTNLLLALNIRRGK